MEDAINTVLHELGMAINFSTINHHNYHSFVYHNHMNDMKRLKFSRANPRASKFLPVLSTLNIWSGPPFFSAGGQNL